MIYDATAHTATGKATGVGSVDLSAGLTLSGATHTNAGTYATYGWSLHDTNGNYADASGTVSDLIKQANTSTSTSNATATFGDVRVNLTATVKNMSNGAPVNESTVTFTLMQGTVTIGNSVTSGTVAGGTSFSLSLPNPWYMRAAIRFRPLTIPPRTSMAAAPARRRRERWW